ncbi:light-harvesting protein [Nannochloropsis gaditana]|uniref:Light-harvesting protein n=1 Tax=Nannochloropsis gaditana TaxID=72520 RepID=W7T8I0_9STRA|nr:light-harvesting protein [Nannochloropsis gaditana]
MKTVFALAALLPCAAGFVAPVAFPTASSAGKAVRGRTTMMAERSKSLPFLMKPKNLDGSMAGDVGFDPLGLSEINEVGIDLYWLREAELKHCRLGMMAAAGILFVEAVGPAPGFPSTKSQMDAFWTVYAEKPSLVGAALVAIAILEVISGVATTQGRQNGDRAPGDYNFDPLGFGKDPAKFKDLQLKEVKNGRLAMIAAAGMILQGVSTHQGALQNLNGN